MVFYRVTNEAIEIVRVLDQFFIRFKRRTAAIPFNC
jgi:hypothetical protein